MSQAVKWSDKPRNAETDDYDNNAYGYQKDFKTALPQLIAVSVKNLLLLGYGMTLGFPTILMPAVSNPTDDEVLHLQTSQISWISSINLIVVPVGCALSGVVTAPLGRRRAMQLVNIPFFIAWLMLHFATTSTELYIALSLTGLAGGLLEAPVLTYVAEITQPHLRGALTATSSMCIIIGVFTQFLFGLFFYWRTVALINITFPILAVIALCFVPESPHWLISRKRFEESKKSLQWLRGWTSPHNILNEFNDIQALFKIKVGGRKESRIESVKEILSYYMERSFLVPYFLVSFAFFVGHFSGMTTLQTYAVSIFQALKAPIDKYYATLILGVVQIAGSLICVALVHYTGKRLLTFISTIGTGVCCLIVAFYDVYIQTTHDNTSNVFSNSSLQINETNVSQDVGQNLSWIPMTFLMLLAGLSHIGIRLLPWILMGEVFSTKTRSGASGLSSAIGYIIGFLTNKLFISMVTSMSISGTYGFYGIISFFGTIVLYFILPETEGKKLMDIENHFAGIKRISNNIYRSKKHPNKQNGNFEKNNTVSGGMANPTFELESSKL